MKKFKYLHSVIKDNYFKLLILTLTTIGYVVLVLLQPIIIGFIIDNVINLEPINNNYLNILANLFNGVEYIRENLWIGALIILFITSLSALLVFFRSRLNGKISEGIAYNIKNSIFDNLMHLPFSYFGDSKSGDLIQRSTSDVDTVRRVFAGQYSEFIYAISMVVIAFYIMLEKNNKLALIASALFPVILIFAIIFFIFVQKHFLKLEDAESNLTNNISESLAANKIIKAFNNEAYESLKFKDLNKKYSNAGKKLINSLALYWGISDLICFSSILLVLVNSIIMVLNNQISIGDVFVFVSYISMIVWPLRHMGRILADLGKVNVALMRISEIIYVEKEDLNSGLKPHINGNIEIKNLSFKFDDEKNNVLEDININIKAGSKVALIGPTGSGKSSLVHLLLGLYDYKGSIKIDGYELSDISKAYLRDNISIVLQEPFLFSKTIKENITISNPYVNNDKLKHIANIAHVDEFIDNFDLGYETMVGERGTTLSGGQKQRMAIARTIINDSKILIFDDSLSALDSETDAKIQKSLKSFFTDITTIIITQRINSAKDADNIFVLENGIISESGTHDELILNNGLYKRLYDVQGVSEYEK